MSRYRQKTNNKIYNTSDDGVLEKNKVGNGARVCWDCSVLGREKASMRRCYLMEDLKEVREQVVWTSRGIQQEKASIKASEASKPSLL